MRAIRAVVGAVAAVAVVAAVSPAAAGSPAAAVAPVPRTGCAEGPLALVAASLAGAGAEVAAEGDVGALRTALVTEPSILPGVRHRLLRTATGWCAASAFNFVWNAAGGGGAVATAAAYAQVAAAPYFDGVTVEGARLTAPGTVRLRTHARTNGVIAEWTVRVDGEGVREARWTATRFAVAPFEAQPEGLTALPGVTRTYRRDRRGLLVAQEPFLPAANPTTTTEVKLPDGFTIDVLLSESSYGPNAGLDTGVTPVDFLRLTAATAEDNYLEFLDWGFERRWPSDRGTIHVDDNWAATCLACVVIEPNFNIHLSSAVRPGLLALGYDYPGASDYDVVSNVVGHEMFHNFQIAYAERYRSSAHWSSAFSEGTARMQEALHSYSGISHQPDSLVLAEDFNGCNGWDGVRSTGFIFILAEYVTGPMSEDIDAAMAKGPFAEHSYDACFFWLAFQGARGTDVLVDVVEAMYDHVHVENETAMIFGAVEQATGQSVAVDLAAFAAAAITGQGYRLPAGKAGEPLDWGPHLDRWQPPLLPAGGSRTRSLSDGGMFAVEVTAATTPRISGEGARLFAVRSAAGATTVAPVAANTVVKAPAQDERVWLVAVQPEAGTVQVTLQL